MPRPVLSPQYSILNPQVPAESSYVCQQSPGFFVSFLSVSGHCTELYCTVQGGEVGVVDTALHTTVMDMSKTPLTLRVDYKSQASLDPRALRNRDLLRATGS